MFDALLRPLIDPPLNAAARRLAKTGITADALTLTGFCCGMIAAGAIALGFFWTGLAFLFCNRLLDGLDGALARATRRTDRGGFLDITLDFAFYAAIPLGFALTDPARNALAAAFLLASFYLNGSAFLSFAALATKRGLKSEAQGVKSFYYLAGLAEGAETIAVFVLFCLFPPLFPLLAYGFALLTALSGMARIIAVSRRLRD